MTELIEGVSVGLVSETTTDCPFDHDSNIENPPYVENYFIGIGKTLGNKMAAQVGTHTSSHPLFQSQPKQPQKINPNDKLTHEAHRLKKPISIDSGMAVPNLYPVTCAAHHLIPAQASLKRAKTLLNFMVCKEKPEDVKGGGKVKGQVYSDVGYDVNGSQNGMYLPGTYAVYGLWQRSTSVMDDEDWEPSDNHDEEDVSGPVAVVSGPVAGGTPELSGRLHEINSNNKKWQYVKQAMSICEGQYHDAHGDYSTFVISVLQKIGGQYFLHMREINSQRGCKPCQKRVEKFKQHLDKIGFPTPFALVERLNGVSERLSKYLNGKQWKLNIYTSRWGLAYMYYLKSK
jgi:hypothetical protein